MKKIIFAAAMLCICSDANAISQINAATQSCHSIQSALTNEREAIVRYPSPSTRLIMFDRYVSPVGQCSAGQTVAMSSVPSTDNPSCAVSACSVFHHGHH